MKVYLAGGMRSGWQRLVRAQIPGMTWYSPEMKDESQMALREYAAWDFCHIRRADILFAYMERDNPSGFGMAVEIGYAKALGKTVVLVLEPHDTFLERHLQFMAAAADVVFDNLDQGIRYLCAYAPSAV